MTGRRAHQQPSWALAKTTSTKGALAELAKPGSIFLLQWSNTAIRQHDGCRPCRTGLSRVLPLAASVIIASINCERQQDDYPFLPTFSQLSWLFLTNNGGHDERHHLLHCRGTSHFPNPFALRVFPRHDHNPETSLIAAS